MTILGTPTVLGDGSGEARGFRQAWQIREWLHSRFEIVVDRPESEDYRWVCRRRNKSGILAGTKVDSELQSKSG